MAVNKLKRKAIEFDEKRTFGVLQYLDFTGEKRKDNLEIGGEDQELVGRRYNVLSKGQKMQLVVVLPDTVDQKDFDYRAEVTLVNPKIEAYGFANFMGADIVINVHADDMVLVTNGKNKQKPQEKPEAGAA